MPPLEEFGSPCVCGCEHFERVIVERVLGHAVVTDLMACVECRCVYYSPLPRPAPAPPSAPVKAWTPPATDEGLLGRYGASPPAPREHQPDTHEKFLTDIKEAAKDYVKPGRHTPPRHRKG